MKFTACLLTIAFVSVSFGANAQKVTIHIKNGTVIQVMKELETQVGLGCTNTDHLLDNAFPVTVDVTDGDIEAVLKICSKGQYFVLDLQGTQIVASPRYIRFFGRIKNSLDEPIEGVRVTADGSGQSAVSNVQGRFALGEIFANALITVTADKIRPRSLRAEGKTNLEILVQETVTELQAINVVASTGHQYVYRKFSPSSIFVVGNTSLQTQSGNTITERMNHISLGLLPTVNATFGINQPKLHSITVRSTLFANPNPLIVVDNFPFYGDINDINPDDIAEVNLLKDATVTSQWGTKSGNGVIVITTKSGKYNHPMELTVNSSLTIRKAPNLFYYPIMNPGDKTEFLQKLFKTGFYLPMEYSPVQLAIPSVVETLIKHRNGSISDDELSYRLQNLEGDVRNDLRDHIYRKASSEKHFSAQLSGGTAVNSYFLSFGYDYQLPIVKASQKNRKTLAFNHNYAYKNRLELSTAVWYLQNQEHNIDDIPEIREPIDSSGVFVSQPLFWRQNYIDSAGKGKLLDWHYNPGIEFGLRNKTTIDENIRLRSNLKWTLLKGLDFNFFYQYQKNTSETRWIKNKNSYEVRNLVNSFTQRVADSIVRPIPVGDVLDMVNSSMLVNNFRPHLVFTNSWATKHDLKIQLGTEHVRIKENVNAAKAYGYSENMPTMPNQLDYSKSFLQYANEFMYEKIPVADPSYATISSFASHFFITNYTFASKISASASARMDKASLTPQIVSDKFIKSFSTGIGWIISSENFYRMNWAPYLKLRASIGTNGNAPIPGLLTPTNQTAGTLYNNVYQQLKAPHWESTRTVNMGLDFCTKNNLIQGSIDFYRKIGKDLIVFRPVNSARPDSLLTDNLASTQGSGIDVLFNSQNLNGKFRWSTKLLFTYVNDHVATFYDTTLASWWYCEQSYQNVVPGKAVYGMFSYEYGGLDPTTGNPIGYFQGHKSDNYAAILEERGSKQLKYHGRSTPKIYGSLINEFSIGALNLSVVIAYKLGYYFRRNSINYYDLAYGFSNGSPDYDLRWKKSGDEQTTDVPSAVVPASRDRDLFYAYSSVLVERGDHIRLQSINTSFNCKSKWLGRYHFKNCTFFLNLNNIGILWRANDQGIDPDQTSYFPTPTSLFAGMKLSFK